MNSTGMARKVDDLGRIVLPVEMRRMFGIRAGDQLEIAVEAGAILLRKIEARCVFCGEAERLRAYRGKRVCDACSTDLGAPSPGATVAPPTAPPAPPAPPAPTEGPSPVLGGGEPHGGLVHQPLGNAELGGHARHS